MNSTLLVVVSAAMAVILIVILLKVYRKAKTFLATRKKSKPMKGRIYENADFMLIIEGDGKIDLIHKNTGDTIHLNLMAEKIAIDYDKDGAPDVYGFIDSISLLVNGVIAYVFDGRRL